MQDRFAGQRPRVLVTGFSAFPGAPFNPTERLIGALDAAPASLGGLGEIRTEVLAVEYESVPQRVDAIGAEFSPDIAIHFGLSEKAAGFTLERRARNAIAADRADNAGARPEATLIVPDGGDVASRLPLDQIHDALVAQDLPTSWSDDAGGYLCNYLFYLSCGRLRPAFAPEMAGFIHVPPLKPLGEDGATQAMSHDELVAGALVVIETCVGAWRARRAI